MTRRVLFREYQVVARRNTKLPLARERQLVARAKKGDTRAESVLLTHLIGFFLFRIQTTLWPWVVEQHGEDIFQECVLLARQKISSYRHDYRDRAGALRPVHLSSYMWKSVTGMMFTYVKSRRVPGRRSSEDLAGEAEE